MTRPAVGAEYTGKMNKDDVNYRTQAHFCRNCDFYRAGACKIVDGNIAPDYVCDKWILNSMPKTGVFADFYMEEYHKAKKAV